MEAIKAAGLCKRYRDVTAVEDLNLTVRQGELFALLGVNGAGKTTTIKMLSCLTQPSGGEAWLLGHSIVHAPNEVKRLIGVSPQETAVAPNLTVEENLRLICGIYGFGKERQRQKTEEMCARFGLSAVAKKPAGKLSGGWQRRLSLALALIGEPQILFLDEPTLGLDVLARRELWHLISRLHGEKTIVLTTHYLEEAEALSDRVGVMAGGHLLAVDTPDGLKKKTGCDSFEDAFIRLVGGEARI